MRRAAPLLALLLTGCTGAEIAGAVGALGMGAKLVLDQNTPTEGPVLPPDPTPGGLNWWLIGGSLLALVALTGKGEKKA